MASPSITRIPCRDEGYVELAPAGKDGTRLLSLHLSDESKFAARRSVKTTFPDRVIASFLEHMDLAYVPDAIARHEDPAYVAWELDRLISAYFGPEGLNGMRVLDFGCGPGASTFALASKWTNAAIIGVELSPNAIAVARDIQAFRKYPNLEFQQSPGPESLPPGIGDFDAIVLSAVYEHLLPAEREYLLPMLWSIVRPGGYVLITETPHRLAPVETHSTGIVGINYVPDSMAAFMAAKFARKHHELNRRRTWPEHLRGGLRGGTERGIVRHLTAGSPENAVLLQPRYGNAKSRAQLWVQWCSPRFRTIKRLLAAGFEVTDKLWDCVPTPGIDIVIQKKR